MSKPQKWRAGLPEIDWKDPEYIIKVHQVLNGQPVSYLNESQIDLPQTGNKTVIAKWAAHIFQQQGGYAIHPVIGAVGFDKRSAERSLGHGGFSKYKNMAFLAVKDVLEKGIIVAVDDARDNERSYFVSAPIFITNQKHTGERIATVLVHKDMNIQKMYLHSVIEKENLLMPLQCRTDQMQKAPRHPTSLTPADIQNILHIALTVNTEKHLQQTPNAHTPTKQTESLINLHGLCPREAGKKLFQVTQGALSQWDLMQRSAAAAGFILDKKAMLAVQGQHPLIIEDTLMSKPQKWRAGLPEIDWKDPEYIIKVHQVLNGQPVSYLNESQIDLPKVKSKTEIAKWAAHIFQQQGGYAIHPVIGAVGFDKRSAERSLWHGNVNDYKNMAFLAVKDVLEKGIIVAVDDARDNERSYFVSAPIFITNQKHTGERIATVLVHKDMNIQKMYLHSVIEKENLLVPRLCRTDQMQKASRHPTSLTSADVHNLLHIALTVNTEKHLQQTPNTHTPTKQTESLINLHGLCPREAGKKLFQVTQGALSQWDLMQRSAAAAGFILDKKAMLAVQGQHPLIIEDTLMKAVKVNIRHTQNEKTRNPKDITR